MGFQSVSLALYCKDHLKSAWLVRLVPVESACKDMCTVVCAALTDKQLIAARQFSPL